MITIVIFVLFLSASELLADCLGPVSSPIVKIDIKHCQLSENYDNTLKLTGKARQIFLVYWRGLNATGNIELIPKSKAISKTSFWISASYRCDALINSPEKLWLYDDICNDTGQNIPSFQLQELWQNIKLKLKAIK